MLWRRAFKHGGRFTWSVRLVLETRHGLPIFDQPGSVHPGGRTLLCTIDAGSRYYVAEPYTVVYGVAADGMELSVGESGWTATMRGSLAEEQTAWLRIDFKRLAGDERALAPAHRDELEADLAGFGRRQYDEAFRRHCEQFEAFWHNTADVAVAEPDDFETTRRYMLHLCEYMLHCGNDHALGGTVQFLLLHQNGWAASNFHDNHYIVDGLARANLWREAEGNVRWMRDVMKPDGRPFPWMLNYDGFAPSRGTDRAPMSDANRALLAMRIYELAGSGRDQLLRDVVYPIMRAVAEHALSDWFYEEDGRTLFRPVENDVMDSEARVSEAGTVVMYLTVLRKAAAYAELLGVDSDRRAAWLAVADSVELEQRDGLYVPWHNAPPTAGLTCWFLNSFYLAEAQEYLDEAAYRRSRDRYDTGLPFNGAWIGSAAASSEIRLGRADRAEQLLSGIIRHRTFGPGYFSECEPSGVAALPPLATAHGAYLTAACEQVVLPDFWRPRVFIGRGLPSHLRATRVTFSSLRGPAGALISGTLGPRFLDVTIHHTGDPTTLDVVLRLPCSLDVEFVVLLDGRPAQYTFEGEAVTLSLPLQTSRTARIELHDAR